jgi:hypothetical protein
MFALDIQELTNQWQSPDASTIKTSGSSADFSTRKRPYPTLETLNITQ